MAQRVAQRVHGSAFVEAALFEGRAEGVLHAALGHRLGGLWPGRCGHDLRRERAARDCDAYCQYWRSNCRVRLRQRHVAILGALAMADVNHHAGAVDVGDLQMGAFLQAQAAGVDGGRDKLVTRQSDAGKNLAHFRQAEDDGQLLLRGRTHDAEDGPVTFERLLIEEPDAADGDGHGVA